MVRQPHDHLHGSLGPIMSFHIGCSAGWPFHLSQWLFHLFAFSSLTSPLPNSGVAQGSITGPLLFPSCRDLTQCPTLNIFSLIMAPTLTCLALTSPLNANLSIWMSNRQLKLTKSPNELLEFPHQSASATAILISTDGNSDFIMTRAPGPVDAVHEQILLALSRWYHALLLLLSHTLCCANSHLVGWTSLPMTTLLFWSSPLCSIQQPGWGCYKSDHVTLFKPLQRLPISGLVKAKVLNNTSPAISPLIHSASAPLLPHLGPLHLLLPWITPPLASFKH